jgi:hypothetical protein
MARGVRSYRMRINIDVVTAIKQPGDLIHDKRLRDAGKFVDDKRDVHG